LTVSRAYWASPLAERIHRLSDCGPPRLWRRWGRGALYDSAAPAPASAASIAEAAPAKPDAAHPPPHPRSALRRMACFPAFFLVFLSAERRRMAPRLYPTLCEM